MDVKGEKGRIKTEWGGDAVLLQIMHEIGFVIRRVGVAKPKEITEISIKKKPVGKEERCR